MQLNEQPLDREVTMNTFVPHYTRPRPIRTTEARDIRPVWEPRKFSDNQAKLIATMMAERSISQAQLLAVFPERPTTFDDGSKVIAWVKAQAVTSASPASPAQATTKDGYFAIPTGELGFDKPHFFRLKTSSKGKWSGTQFLTEQASDENYPVRGARKVQVMAWLAEHEDEARALYGTLISRCSRCNRTLTDHDNSYFPMYGPECGAK